MKSMKIYWIEDKKVFVVGLLKRMNYSFEDLGLKAKTGELDFTEYVNSRDIWIYQNDQFEINIEHTDYVYELALMSKWAKESGRSIFLIDFNLKNHNGDGINGDEIIKEIRNHNDCQIIFYSSESSQQGLREKIGDLQNVECLAREHLFDYLSSSLGDYLKWID